MDRPTRDRRMTFRLTAGQARRVEEIAAEQQRSQASVGREALVKYLTARERESAAPNG